MIKSKQKMNFNKKILIKIYRKNLIMIKLNFFYVFLFFEFCKQKFFYTWRNRIQKCFPSLCDVPLMFNGINCQEALAEFCKTNDTKLGKRSVTA